MTAKILQWMGLLAVLGAAGFAAAALMVVKDRIEITVKEADAGQGVDPLALVKDDLRQVHTDLEALTTALSSNFERVAHVLEQRGVSAAEVREELKRFAGEVGRSDARTAQAITALAARIEALGTASAAAPAQVAAAHPAPETEPKVAAPVEPAAGPAGPGFLSFRLPSRGLAFDAPQHYTILPSLSRVGFDAKSTLHDFTGVTSRVSGDLYANLASAAPAWRGAVRCEVAGLETGHEGRDENLREHLLAEKHPVIEFAVEGFAAGGDGIDVAGRTAKGTVRGTMKIRGTSRPVSMPVRISVDASRRVVIEGETPLKLTDYGVPVPSKIGLISMQDEVKVWIALRARSVGAWHADR